MVRRIYYNLKFKSSVMMKCRQPDSEAVPSPGTEGSGRLGGLGWHSGVNEPPAPPGKLETECRGWGAPAPAPEAPMRSRASGPGAAGRRAAQPPGPGSSQKAASTALRRRRLARRRRRHRVARRPYRAAPASEKRLGVGGAPPPREEAAGPRPREEAAGPLAGAPRRHDSESRCHTSARRRRQAAGRAALYQRECRPGEEV